MQADVFCSTQNVINQFSELAHSDRCMIVGNVAIGTQLTVDHLRNYYDAIVMVTAVTSLVLACDWLLCRLMVPKKIENWMYLVRYVGIFFVII